MNIIIPACGEGKRFQNSSVIKPLIRVLDKEIICYVLDNLRYTKDDNIFIIYNNSALEKICYKYPDLKMIKLNKKTKGAAETLLEGLQIIFAHYHFYDKSLVVDCDTFYTEDIVNIFRRSNSNMIFYTKRCNETPIYSYITLSPVKVEEENYRVLDIKEKIKISDNAATGALGFSSTIKLFESCKHVVAKGINHNGECYTSLVVKKMISECREFKNERSKLKDEHSESEEQSVEINKNIFQGRLLKRVFSLGTPEEVRDYVSSVTFFLFDLDGTLINTDGIYFKVWSKILSSYNISLNEKIYNEIIQGNTDKHVLEMLHLDKLSETENSPGINDINGMNDMNIGEKIGKMKDDIFLEHISEVRIIEGSVKFINKIRKLGHKCCIVTNSNRVVAENIIKKFDIDVDFIISSESCINGKPSPDPYIKAIKKYRTNNDRCIIFEDSKSGILSAKSVNPRLLVGIKTFFDETELFGLDVDIVLKDYNHLSVENLLLCRRNFCQKIKYDLMNNFDCNEVVIDDEKRKGGFISDVIGVVIVTNQDSKRESKEKSKDCILKYDSNSSTGDISKMAKQLELCKREFLFYNQVYPVVNILIPHCYGTIDTENISNGILLEDMFKKGYKVGIDLNNERIEVSLSIINSMAKMHAKFWNSTDSLTYVKKCTDPIFRPFMQNFINERMEHFLDKWDFMIKEKRGLYISMAKNFSRVQQNLSQGNTTFVHGDIKSGNLFYGDVSNDPNDIYFIDWQHCVIGKGPMDMIFFLIESFNVDKIKEYYPIFVDYYYDKLSQYGNEYNVEYDRKEYLKDVRDSISYVPFFTLIWFACVHDDELIDKEFPHRFLTKFNTIIDIPIIM